jgi:prepilin-type processing-associated H-X9-DG protein
MSTGWQNNGGTQGANRDFPVQCFSDKVALLPFIERNPEYDMSKRFGMPYDPDWYSDPNDPMNNNATMSGRIPIFNCPANGNTLFGGRSNFTYALNQGTTHKPPHDAWSQNNESSNGRHNGVAWYRWGGVGANPGWTADDSPVGFQAILDGTSNTAAYSEFVVQNPAYDGFVTTKKSIIRQQLFTWVGGASTAEIRAQCLNQTGGSGRSNWRGRSWSWAFVGVGAVYVHDMLPNEKSCHSWSDDWMGNTVMAATSNHTGGVNVAKADGSVQFVNQIINTQAWWSLGTRDGAEAQSGNTAAPGP